MFRPRHKRRQQLARDWRERRGADFDPEKLPDGWVEPVPSSRSRLRVGAKAQDLLRLAIGSAPSRVAAAIGAAFLSLLTPALILAPRYRIQAVDVTGNQLTDRDAIVRASGLVGRNAFLVDPARAAYLAGSQPGIAGAGLTLTLPRRAVLQVVERPVLLRWQDRRGVAGLDANGGVHRDADLPADLPQVIDEGDALSQGIDCMPAQTVRTALAYAERFGPLLHRPSIGFIARAPEGWEVWLGQDATLLEQQSALLAEQRRALLETGSAIRLLDLRFPSRPYYR